VERGLSAASVAAYRSDLEAFGRHLARHGADASRLDRRELTRYLAGLRAKGDLQGKVSTFERPCDHPPVKLAFAFR